MRGVSKLNDFLSTTSSRYCNIMSIEKHVGRQNPLRLCQVEGFDNRKNDIVYTQPLNDFSKNRRVLVFFPGDVQILPDCSFSKNDPHVSKSTHQDYIENMEAHRDNKRHKQWNLEDTALKLQNKFPENHVLVVKPSSMGYKTFSCFQNFVKSNELGVPDHTENYCSLKHLSCLIKKVSEKLQDLEEIVSAGSEDGLENLGLQIVGFSKGCVVLNQFLYEFHYYKTKQPDEEILGIINRITDLYWLDGGHSGGRNTWVNDEAVLDTLCSLGIKVHVHVSPYQIQDDRRPWIKREEKCFSDYLSKHACNIDRNVHFENVSPSILTHFEVLNVFK